MNGTQRGTYWLKTERLRRKLEDKYGSLIAEAMLKEWKRFAEILRRNGVDGARSYLGSVAWNEDLLKIMKDMYKECAVIFGNASYRATSVMSRKSDDPFGWDGEFIQEMLDFLFQYALMLIALMTQTTKKRLFLIISISLQENKTIDEISDIILSDAELESVVKRAKTIIRTEVMRASNYASLLSAKKHPFEVDKVWVSVRDARTRRIPRNNYDHWDMDGQTKKLDEPFLSTDKLGKTIIADFPGDPKTPKGFTINCRCTLAYVPRRDANGNLIRKN